LPKDSITLSELIVLPILLLLGDIEQRIPRFCRNLEWIAWLDFSELVPHGC
jgi:hypothetical protein